MSYITVIESGKLTDDKLDSLLDWVLEDSGEVVGALPVMDDNATVEKYFKGTVQDGKRFLYFGNDEQFAAWQKAYLQ